MYEKGEKLTTFYLILFICVCDIQDLLSAESILYHAGINSFK